jgi:hypothetical protein
VIGRHRLVGAGLIAALVVASGALRTTAAPAEPAKVAGDWNVVLELSAIRGQPKITLKQDGEKLTGSYFGRYGEAPLEGTIKETKIQFTVTLNAEGTQTSGYFSGEVDGDRMSGAVEFEGAGEGKWSATRAQAKQ